MLFPVISDLAFFPLPFLPTQRGLLRVSVRCFQANGYITVLQNTFGKVVSNHFAETSCSGLADLAPALPRAM